MKHVKVILDSVVFNALLSMILMVMTISTIEGNIQTICLVSSVIYAMLAAAIMTITLFSKELNDYKTGSDKFAIICYRLISIICIISILFQIID